jgi:hypothetical protein
MPMPPMRCCAHAWLSKASACYWRFDVLAGAGALVMTGAALARYAQAALGVVDSPLREACTH